jgi:hypothetical protein
MMDAEKAFPIGNPEKALMFFNRLIDTDRLTSLI